MTGEPANPTTINKPVNQTSLRQPEQTSDRLPLAETGPHVDATVLPLLKGPASALLGHIGSLMQVEASRQQVRILNVSYSGHTSPEDGTQKIVLTQVADLTSNQALDYRRKMFKLVAGWIKALSPEQAKFIQDNIIINISWNSDAAVT